MEKVVYNEHTMQLYEEYLIYNGKYDGKEDKRWQYIRRPEIPVFEKKLNKEFIHFSALQMLDLFLSFRIKGKVMTKPNVITAYKNRYRQFFDFCCMKGYLKMNVFNDEILSYNNLYAFLMDENSKCSEDEKKNSKLFYTPEEFNEICNKVKLLDNSFYYETIIRLYYEGVRNSEELLSITNADCDLENKTIRMKDRIITISDELKNCIKEMQDTTVWYAKRNRTYQLISYKDMLIKGITNRVNKIVEYESDDAYKYNLKINIASYKLKEIADLTGYTINQKIIYDSGVFNFILSKVGSEEAVFDLLIGKDDVNMKVIKLNQFAIEYGAKYAGSDIRFIFAPYADQLAREK